MSTLRVSGAYRSGSGGWWVETAYDEAGVEALKRAVPAGLRTWDEENKRWWIDEAAVGMALPVLPGLEAYRQQGALL